MSFQFDRNSVDYIIHIYIETVNPNMSYIINSIPCHINIPNHQILKNIYITEDTCKLFKKYNELKQKEIQYKLNEINQITLQLKCLDKYSYQMKQLMKNYKGHVNTVKDYYNHHLFM